MALSLIDGVERLEVYFGQFLPQFLVSLLAPLLIFAVIAWIDLPVAVVMLVAALVALSRRRSGTSMIPGNRLSTRTPTVPSPRSSWIRCKASPP